jgi:hypothetical protein
VNAISPDGATFAWLDFGALHVMNTTSGETRVVANTTIAPRLAGFPQWFD